VGLIELLILIVLLAWLFGGPLGGTWRSGATYRFGGLIDLLLLVIVIAVVLRLLRVL
jgi:hypothetical protein